MAKTQLMSVAEYFNTPETSLPMELVYGVLRVADAPFAQHQAAVGDFYLALATHVREHNLGEIWLSPIDVLFDAEKALILQPDLLFISKERSHIVTDRVRGIPDMVVEILSPHPRIGKLEERIGWFTEYGVRECWLLHQQRRQLEVLQFADGAIARRTSFGPWAPIRSEVLPDFDRTPGSILRW